MCFGVEQIFFCVMLWLVVDFGEWCIVLFIGEFGNVLDDLFVMVCIVGDLMLDGVFGELVNFWGMEIVVILFELGLLMVFVEVVVEVFFGGCGIFCLEGMLQMFCVMWNGGVCCLGGEESGDVECKFYQVIVEEVFGLSKEIVLMVLVEFGDNDNNYFFCFDMEVWLFLVSFLKGYFVDLNQDFNEEIWVVVIGDNVLFQLFVFDDFSSVL